MSPGVVSVVACLIKSDFFLSLSLSLARYRALDWIGFWLVSQRTIPKCQQQRQISSHFFVLKAVTPALLPLLRPPKPPVAGAVVGITLTPTLTLIKVLIVVLDSKGSPQPLILMPMTTGSHW